MTDSPCGFDIPRAAEYARGCGFVGVTSWTIRAAISAGRLPSKKVGKRWYVTKISMDTWLFAERRNRP
jgi:hypothetical protein